MAVFYFFTESDKLNAQTSIQAFGPTGIQSGKDTFHITDRHNSAGNPAAFAVCDGEVFVIADKNNPQSLLNLVLRPFQQPSFNFPYIKYFVYRGILRNSILDTGKIAPASKSDLTNSIWESQRKLNKSFDKSKGNLPNASNDTNSPPLTKSIEAVINKGTPGTTPVYRMFYKNEKSESQFPKVNAGWKLGEFGPDFGFEIILDQQRFEPDLDYAQQSDFSVKVDQLTAMPNQAQFFSYWNSKESILNFVDPAAFFGSFYEDKIKVIKNGIVETCKKKEVYKTILNPCYKNKNIIYLDIRNELNYSLNYYKNYSGYNTATPLNNLKLNLNSSVSSVAAFPEIDYNNFNGYNWPLLALQPGSFSAPGNSPELSIQLSFPKQDNPNPILVISKGEQEVKSIKKSFSKKDFLFLEFPQGGDFTDIVTLITPNFEDNSLVEPVSNYLQLKYIKQAPQCAKNNTPPPGAAPNTVLRAYYDLENIFTPVDMIIPWGTAVSPGNHEETWVHFDEIYVDALRTSGQSFMAHTGIAKSGNGDVTLFAFANEKIISNRRTKNAPFSLVGRKWKVDNESFLERLASKFSLIEKKVQLDLGNPTTDPVVSFLDQLDPTTIDKFDQINLDDFTFINLKKNEFDRIRSIVAGTDPVYNTPPFLPGFRVHLGLKFIAKGQDAKDVDYINYEFVLRGYAYARDVGGNIDNTRIEIQEIETGISHYRLYQYLTMEQLTGEDPDRKPPQFKGRGYFIDDSLPAENFVEPNGQISTQVKKIKIVCNVYLYRGEGVEVDEFCEYMEYFRNNVQQVWNSASNKGLVVTYDPLVSTPMSGTFNRPYIVDASGVKVMQANARHFYALNDREVLLYVHPKGGRTRSFICGNKRTGVMYYDKEGSPYFEKSQNTPAHEFGHILGLGDRYAYYANVESDINGVGAASTSNNKYVTKADVASGSTNIYLDTHEDKDYGIRYSWIHNLMSGIEIVPLVSSSAIELEPSFARFHEFLRPEPPVPNPQASNTLFYDKVTVFITPDQFDIILNYGIEKRCRWLLFMKEYNNKGDFDGSFIGIKDISGNKTIVFDDSFKGDYKTYAVNNAGKPGHDPLFNDVDHRMNERFKKEPGETNSPRRAHEYGYFSPYCGNNTLANREPVPDVPLTDISGLRKVTYYDLEVGGNAFGNLGINRIRADVVAIRNSFLANISNPALMPVSILNRVCPLHTALNNIDNNMIWKNDKYAQTGSGDANGISLWNNNCYSNINNADISGRNTGSGIPGAGDNEGNRPYNDFKIDINVNPQPLPSVSCNSGKEKIRTNYKLGYFYFFNRRAIIDIMGENV